MVQGFSLSNWVTPNRRLHLAFGIALVLHLIIYFLLNLSMLNLKDVISIKDITKLNVLILEQDKQDEKKPKFESRIDTALDDKPLLERVVDPERVKDQNVAKDVVAENQTENAAEVLEQKSSSVSLSHTALKEFTDNYVSSENVSDSKLLEAFQESFIELPLGTLIPDSYLIEGYNGIVDVKTDFLGKSICYTFNAASDVNVAYFYICDKEIEFKFKMKK